MDTPEYQTLQHCYPRLLTCITRAPNDVVIRLIPFGILTQSDLSFFSSQANTDAEKAKRILDAVRLQVQLDNQTYYSLIEALELQGLWTKAVCNELKRTHRHYCSQAQPSSSSVASDDTVPSTEALLRLSSVAIQSPASQPIPDSPDLRSVSLNIYQYAVKQTKLETDFNLEERELKRKTEDMVHKFAALVIAVIKALVRNNESVRSMCTYLHHIVAVEAVSIAAREPVLYFTKEFLDEAETSCTDIDGLFRKLDGYYSWFNYRLVKNIINAFLDEDIKVQTKLSEYEKQMKRYCDNRICHLQDSVNGFGTHGHSGEPHVYKVNEIGWDQMRVNQLEEVKEIVGEIVGVKFLLIRSVRNGCVELTLDFQTHVANAVFPLTQDQVDALKKHNIQYCGKGNKKDKKDSWLLQCALSDLIEYTLIAV